MIRSEKWLYIQRDKPTFLCLEFLHLTSSSINANYSKQFRLVVVFLPCCRAYSIISAWPTFMALLKADQTRGYLAIPWGLENMFVSLLACVFAVMSNTLMSALRYAGLIHGSYSSSSPLLCVSGTNSCLLCPPENTKALTMMLSYSSTCMLVPWLQSKNPKAKQTTFCLHLSPSICDHQADRCVCSCCNRPIVFCLGSKSYLHYTFYKQTNKRRHISGEDEGSRCVFIFEDYLLVYIWLKRADSIRLADCMKLPPCALASPPQKQSEI